MHGKCHTSRPNLNKSGVKDETEQHLLDYSQSVLDRTQYHYNKKIPRDRYLRIGQTQSSPKYTLEHYIVSYIYV